MIRYSREHVAWFRAEPANAEAEYEAALVLAADDYGYDCDGGRRRDAHAARARTGRVTRGTNSTRRISAAQ